MVGYKIGRNGYKVTVLEMSTNIDEAPHEPPAKNITSGQEMLQLRRNGKALVTAW